MGFYVDRFVVVLVSTVMKPVFQAEHYECGADFTSRYQFIKLSMVHNLREEIVNRAFLARMQMQIFFFYLELVSCVFSDRLKWNLFLESFSLVNCSRMLYAASDKFRLNLGQHFL